MADMQEKSVLMRLRIPANPKGTSAQHVDGILCLWCSAAAYLPYISVYCKCQP
jgi:hypothetical protein